MVTKVLMLEDDANDAEIIQHILLKKSLNWEFSLATDKDTYLQALDEFRPDIILSDHSLPQFNSVVALTMARQRYPGIPFIIVTGTASEEFAAGIMKSGADDYILKDRLTRLSVAIDTALRLRQNEKEKLKAAEKLMQSEEKYRTLVEQAFDSIIIYTPDLIIADCNRIACSIMGYTREELKGHNITEFFFKEDIIARPLYFDALKTGKRIFDYRRLKRKDGSGIEMEIGSKMMPDGNMMAIARDITGRKKAEQKIIQSETNLRAIFENTSEGFVLLDRNAVIMAFNNKAGDYALFSREKEMRMGQSIYDFVDEPRKGFFQEIIAKALDGENTQFDGSFEIGNDIISWINFSVTPVIEMGHVKAICIAGRDITEKKMMEQEIIVQKIQEQKKIARAIIIAQEKERNYLGQELHDNINQILASTKLYLELAGNKSGEIKELIRYPMELINSSIEEIRLLCSNLVTPLKKIDLEELLRKLVGKFGQNTTIEINFIYSVANKFLPDDLKLNIYRILQEQLNNIVKHAAATKVSVSVQADKHTISVVVEDNGKGFNVNKKRKGVGISNMINRIETFNGSVAIKSSPGKGCRIEIRAPY